MLRQRAKVLVAHFYFYLLVKHTHQVFISLLTVVGFDDNEDNFILSALFYIRLYILLNTNIQRIYDYMIAPFILH